MSTDTFRSSAHAALLFHMYSVTDAKRLIFVVIMREPLSRFKSGFYEFNPKFLGLPRGVRHAHNRTLPAELHMRHTLPPDFKTAQTVARDLEHDWRFDHWFRSMYSLNWRPWSTGSTPRSLSPCRCGGRLKTSAGGRARGGTLGVAVAATAHPGPGVAQQRLRRVKSERL